MVVNFKIFKKASPNNMVTLYMNRREFVDSVTQVEPIGMLNQRIFEKILIEFWESVNSEHYSVFVQLGFRTYTCGLLQQVLGRYSFYWALSKI